MLSAHLSFLWNRKNNFHPHAKENSGYCSLSLLKRATLDSCKSPISIHFCSWLRQISMLPMAMRGSKLPYQTPIFFTIFFLYIRSPKWLHLMLAYVSSVINFQLWFFSSMSVRLRLPGVFLGKHWVGPVLCFQQQAPLGIQPPALKNLFTLPDSIVLQTTILFPNNFWSATLCQSYLSAFPWIH